MQPQYYYSVEIIIIISTTNLFYSGLILIHLVYLYLNCILNLALFIFKAMYSQLGIFPFVTSSESLRYSLRLVRQVLLSQIFPRHREVKWFAQGHTAGIWLSWDSNFTVIQANFFFQASFQRTSCLETWIHGWLPVTLNLPVLSFD